MIMSLCSPKEREAPREKKKARTNPSRGKTKINVPNEKMKDIGEKSGQS
jgi:hypothetical protein